MKKYRADHDNTDVKVYLKDKSKSLSNISKEFIFVLFDDLFPVFLWSSIQDESPVGLICSYAGIRVVRKATSDIAEYKHCEYTLDDPLYLFVEF